MRGKGVVLDEQDILYGNFSRKDGGDQAQAIRERGEAQQEALLLYTWTVDTNDERARDYSYQRGMSARMLANEYGRAADQDEYQAKFLQGLISAAENGYAKTHPESVDEATLDTIFVLTEEGVETGRALNKEADG